MVLTRSSRKASGISRIDYEDSIKSHATTKRLNFQKNTPNLDDASSDDRKDYNENIESDGQDTTEEDDDCTQASNTDTREVVKEKMDSIKQKDSTLNFSNFPSTFLSSELDLYLNCCQSFGTIPDAGATIAFAYNWITYLKVSPAFTIADLLPLCSVLTENKTITHVDLSCKNLGCFAGDMIKRVFERNTTITYLDMSYCNLRTHGAIALSYALCYESIGLRHLILQGNNFSPRSAFELSSGLKANSSLIELDLSFNFISLDGVEILRNVTSQKIRRSSSHNTNDEVSFLDGVDNGFILKTHSNYVIDEIGNTITHGVGLLLSFFGTYILLGEAVHESHPVVYYWACFAYAVSQISMFTASTLAHSFTRIPYLTRIFSILDTSTVAIAIAGTYTPFCLVSLGHTKIGIASCVVVWILAIIGVCLSVLGPSFYRAQMVFYLSMGWIVMTAIKWVIEAVEFNGVLLLVTGGILYTLSGASLLYDQQRYTSYRPMLVLVAAICHFFTILFYVRPYQPDSLVLDNMYTAKELINVIQNTTHSMLIKK